MISSGINLVMTVIGFAVSTMFIVFVCTRLVCARIHFNASRRSFPIASRSDLSVLERGYHGLEPVVVANFPTKKYTDQYFSAAEISQCTVCLSEYNREDVLRILPFCGHSFHVMCIDTWLQQHSTCPVCRISLREIPDRKRLMRPLFSSANRSQYTNRHAYPCVFTHHGCSSTNHDSYGMMDPIQEDRFVPEGDEEEHSGENNNVSGFDDEDNDNRIRKESGNKNVDSPSNA